MGLCMATDPERNETELEKMDRNLDELLQEVRVAQSGVQVLFAFLLTAPLTSRFEELGNVARTQYYVTLAFAGLGAILLIAPTALHRGLFRQGEKAYTVEIANRATIAGLIVSGLAMTGAMSFVTTILYGTAAGAAAGVVTTICWLAVWLMIPLLRRRR
jgi:hypothetical protein